MVVQMNVYELNRPQLLVFNGIVVRWWGKRAIRCSVPALRIYDIGDPASITSSINYVVSI